MFSVRQFLCITTVEDTVFLVGGGGGSNDPLGGGACQPPIQALFGENVCENERIGTTERWS